MTLWALVILLAGEADRGVARTSWHATEAACRQQIPIEATAARARGQRIESASCHSHTRRPLAPMTGEILQ
jgi:hypothetical protein